VRDGNHMGRVGYYTGMAAGPGYAPDRLRQNQWHGPASIPVSPRIRNQCRSPPTAIRPSWRIYYVCGRGGQSPLAPQSRRIRTGRLAHRRADDGPLAALPRAARGPPPNRRDGGPQGLCSKHFGRNAGRRVVGRHVANPGPGRHGNSCWYVAIDIGRLTPLSEFKTKVGTMIDYMKSSRLGPSLRWLHDKRSRATVPRAVCGWPWSPRSPPTAQWISASLSRT
jgi:hypothetical protein